MGGGIDLMPSLVSVSLLLDRIDWLLLNLIGNVFFLLFSVEVCTIFVQLLLAVCFESGWEASANYDCRKFSARGMGRVICFKLRN